MIQQLAVLISGVFNALRGKGGRTYHPSDFMPTARRRKQTPSEMFAAFNAYATAHNARLKARERKHG